MEDVEKLVVTSMAEIEKLLSSKAVVGEPIIVEGNTIIPLMSIGFFFGAGGGSGKGSGKGEKGAKGEGSGEGIGEGAGGGGGIKPTALIIVGKDGLRLEP
ncbi:spore germination protein GerW family protein, partial [Chloroflexota bacterium]